MTASEERLLLFHLSKDFALCSRCLGIAKDFPSLSKMSWIEMMPFSFPSCKKKLLPSIRISLLLKRIKS